MADYVEPNKYNEHVMLTIVEGSGANQGSFVTVDIKTSDANKPAAASAAKPRGTTVNPSSVMQVNTQRAVTLLEETKKSLQKQIDRKKTENSELITQLEKMGVRADDAAEGRKPKVGKENSAVYARIPGIDDYDTRHLLKLDKEIERLYEVAMRKRNKNDEMVRNKINELNEKPALRKGLAVEEPEVREQASLRHVPEEVQVPS